MSTQPSTIAEQVKAYCARIGTDPLLVQGAGGNVSWKDGDVLWVKASGTWLADSAIKDIFVPVGLSHLLDAIKEGDFSITPELQTPSALRPSIETVLHAVMPQRVVVHLHAIDVLAHLVKEEFQVGFESRLDSIGPWTVVDYFKPGAPLAAEIYAALKKAPTAKVVFLRNHGMVIGGEDMEEVNQLIEKLTTALRTTPTVMSAFSPAPIMPAATVVGQYGPIADTEIHQLVSNPALFERLSTDWALYPDHVVFLGPRARAYETWEAFAQDKAGLNELPELIFISGQGVYARPTFSMAKQVQLRCYFDVMVRQQPQAPLRVLSHIEIAELLNWDAEQYRMSLAK